MATRIRKVGSHVEISNTRTGNEWLAGKVVSNNTGWYEVKIDGTKEIVKGRGKELRDYTKPAVPVKVVAPTAEEIEVLEGELDGALTAAQKMAQTLRQARSHYAKTHRPDGTPSADCADIIAKELRDLEPLEVAALADRVLGVKKGTHEEKYGHLNAGQIRMNSGNRIRAAWKAAHESGDEKAIAKIKFVLGLDGDEDEDEEGSED